MNVELSDAIHKRDAEFDVEEHGCARTLCGIHYACATITEKEPTCPDCKDR